MNKFTEKDPQITKGKLTVTVMTSYKLDNAGDTTVFIHEILFQHGNDCLLHTFGIRCDNSDHKLDDILAEESVYIVLNVIKEEVHNYSNNETSASWSVEWMPVSMPMSSDSTIQRNDIKVNTVKVKMDASIG